MTTLNINLLPEDLRPSKGGGGSLPGLPALDRAAMIQIGGGALVGVLLAASPTLLRSMWLEPWAAEVAAQEEEIKAEIDKYNSTLNDLKSQADKKEQLRRQLRTLQNVAGVTASWGSILNELRTLTPGNMWFEAFKADTEKSEISISGSSLDYGSVAYFHRNLEHSEFFANPVLTKTEMTTAGDVSTVKFDMRVTVRQNPEGSK